MREPTVIRATELGRVLEEEGRKARWLAARVGISESHLSRIVSGERLISESLAQRIASALGHDFGVLFEFTLVNEEFTAGVAA